MIEKKPKTTPKKVKLELNRETLRKLSHAELGQVHGGMRDDSDNCQSEHRGGGGASGSGGSDPSWPTCIPQ